MNIVKRDGFEFQVDADGVARVRDVDVAERLGMARPRDIRRTIAGLIEAGELSDVITRAVSARVIAKGGATREQPVIEYWLDKRQAYHVAVLGKTKEAVEFRKRVLDVYIAVEDEWKRRGAELPGPLGKFFRFLLAEKPTEWESCFGPTLVRALSNLYGFAYTDGGRHPFGLRRVNRLIYDAVFSTAVGAELKRRNPDPRHGSNHSQHLSPEARSYFIAQLAIVESLARGSADRVAFWNAMEREYGGGMLQLPMHLDPKRIT